MARRKRSAGKAWRRPLPTTTRTVPMNAAVPERRDRLTGGCVWILAPLLICAFLVPAALDIGPAWSARLGHGVRGTFTAEYCDRGKAGCDWDGYFVSDDKKDQRYAGIDGDRSIKTPGQQVPAIDTGDRLNVYPLGGGVDYILTTVFLVLALWALAFWAVRIPVPALRHARAARQSARARPNPDQRKAR